MTIVSRWTRTLKEGCCDEAVAALKEAFPVTNRSLRIYWPASGPRHTIIMEIEYENMAEYEQLAEEWRKSERAAVLDVRWPKLTEGPITQEFWEVTR